jgi:hypothetical protein
MPWGRLDDSLYDHPKLDRVPTPRRLEAIGLWARSISWCNRFLTDGHIPRSRIPKLDGTTELADLLVAAGLYEETGDGYLVHDFLEFNDARAVVQKKRAAEAKRQADWRERKRQMRNGVTHDVTPSVDESPVTPDVTVSVTPLVTALVTRPPRAAARESRPGPVPVPGPAPVPVESQGSLSVQVPPGGREGTRQEKRNGWTTVGAVVAELEESSEGWTTALTLEERDEWSSFGEEWAAFRDAWLQRGFRHPPKGTAEDSPDDESPSQRALLFSILRDRPTDVPRWIAEAPRRASASQVVGYVLGRWHDIRDEAAVVDAAATGPFG